jgi:perosamine synthetase
MSAALGVAQLKKLDWLLEQRRIIAGFYNKYLSAPNSASLIGLPKIAEGNTHSWFVYVVRILKKGSNRDEIINSLSSLGISTKPYLPSIHLFEFYRARYGYKKGDFPVSESISETALALPFYIGLKEKDVKHITNTLMNVLQK